VQCCGTITNPRLLFLDEPTSGLDSFAALVVMRLLHTYGKRGMMVRPPYKKHEKKTAHRLYHDLSDHPTEPNTNVSDREAVRSVLCRLCARFTSRAPPSGPSSTRSVLPTTLKKIPPP
jgi:hypothetical protein